MTQIKTPPSFAWGRGLCQMARPQASGREQRLITGRKGSILAVHRGQLFGSAFNGDVLPPLLLQGKLCCRSARANRIAPSGGPMRCT